VFVIGENSVPKEHTLKAHEWDEEQHCGKCKAFTWNRVPSCELVW